MATEGKEKDEITLKEGEGAGEVCGGGVISWENKLEKLSVTVRQKL